MSVVGDYVFDTTLVLWVATVLGNGRPWAPVDTIFLAAGMLVLVSWIYAMFALPPEPSTSGHD